MCSIAEFKGRTTDIIQSKNRKNRLKWDEQRLRVCKILTKDLTFSIGIPEGEKKYGGAQKVLSEIMVENFLNLAKEKNLQIKEGM